MSNAFWFGLGTLVFLLIILRGVYVTNKEEREANEKDWQDFDRMSGSGNAKSHIDPPEGKH
jgi:hypothetical protein